MTVTVADEKSALALAPRGLFISGSWRQGSTGKCFEIEDPATELSLTEVADATTDDAMAALDAAVAAQASWAASSPRRRSNILMETANLLTENADLLALLITLEMGKPLAQARDEVAYGADYFRWFSEEAPRSGGTFAPSPDGRSRLLVSKHPVGPCLLVTPWNFPLAMAARKVAPAIAAGCSMVLKPAAETPLTSLALASLLTKAGLPAGVLNVLTTRRPAEIVSLLMQDSRLRKVSFTGSTEVGRILMAQAAHNVLRVSLELGGNAPFLVFDDADLDAAVAGAMTAKLRNMGEACTAANRFLVAQPIADKFAARLAEGMSSLRLGRGTDPDVDVGPLINRAALEKVLGLEEDAVRRGASVVVGGASRSGPGHFFEPTVLIEVDPASVILTQETFGPVAPIIPFDDDEEAVRLANDTPYGLVAYVYSESMKRALRICDVLEVGMVGLNQGIVSNAAAPFGGVKASGIGREGGRVGIDEYQETRYIAAPA
jgi:succinate-semialdehyde dehydrogenase/glutarate-semialdehyde dehydrogenase